MTPLRPSRALVLLAFVLTGCASKPGGSGWSIDRFVYQSHEWQPWTVTLVDTRTGESLWSVDVPVGRQLVVGFRKGVGPNPYKPDMMYWGITEYGRGVARRDNQIPVPPAHARRLDPTLRPTPELPGTPMPGSPFEIAEAPTAPEPLPAAETPARAEPPPAPEPAETPPPAQDDRPPIDLPQGTRKPG